MLRSNSKQSGKSIIVKPEWEKGKAAVGRRKAAVGSGKSPILTYPTCIWRPRMSSPRLNFEKIFGARKLLSLGTVCGTVRVFLRWTILVEHGLVTDSARVTHDEAHTVSRILTRSSAIAEGPRDASCQLKSCQLPRNNAETNSTSPEEIESYEVGGLQWARSLGGC